MIMILRLMRTFQRNFGLGSKASLEVFMELIGFDDRVWILLIGTFLRALKESTATVNRLSVLDLLLAATVRGLCHFENRACC